MDENVFVTTFSEAVGRSVLEHISRSIGNGDTAVLADLEEIAGVEEARAPGRA